MSKRKREGLAPEDRLGLAEGIGNLAESIISPLEDSGGIVQRVILISVLIAIGSLIYSAATGTTIWTYGFMASAFIGGGLFVTVATVFAVVLGLALIADHIESGVSDEYRYYEPMTDEEIEREMDRAAGLI